MFTYTGKHSIRMAKHHRATETTGRTRVARTRTLRAPRVAPPSVMTSRWWVATEGLQYGRAAGQWGTPRAAW
jgi:hypothetical protein